MTLSKSWSLTIILYGFSLGLIVLEVLTGLTISETSMNQLLMLVGISTTAGTTNAIMTNREQIKKVISEMIQPERKVN